MTTIERSPFTTIGTRPIRPDGYEKVMGRARYGNDIRLPGQLAGKILRSPHAHARILSIDTSKAAALPGVHAVITGADMAHVPAELSVQSEGSLVNLGMNAMNIIARDKALYRGHPIAAVAAETAAIAEQAAALIEVKYEVLKPVMDGIDAMQPGAPVLLDDLKTNRITMFRGGGLRDANEPKENTNVATSFTMQIGDLANGFESSDVILEHDYYSNATHQAYIEPQSATASWTPDGYGTIWCSSQSPFTIRDSTAVMLGVPAGHIKVVPMEIGGGFGAKLHPIIEPIVALLAKKAGRPVKVAVDRTEVFDAIGATSAAHIHLKMGFTNDGRIVAADARLVYEAGAYPGSPVPGGANCMFAPYDIPNARVEGHDVVVNKPKVTAYRAPGAPSASFAVEAMIDEFCDANGMDPLEIRMKNAAQEGSQRVNGSSAPKLGLMEVLEAARNSDHWNAPLEGPYKGRGIAAGFWHNAAGQASMTASVLPDGSVALVEGSTDIGGTRISAAMQLAEALGIPVSQVHPEVVDTDSIGYTSATGGSSVTFKQGWAAQLTADDIKRQMRERAAAIWRVELDDVAYEAGVLKNAKNPEQSMTFKQMAARLASSGAPIVGRATVAPRGVGASHAVHIADVEVDPETGKVQVTRFTAIVDAGRAIHPSYVEGQMQGGASQGIGWALNEEFVYDKDGRMVNSSFLDYRIPTSLDLPMIETIIVEVPNAGHPFGVRGVGEIVIVPPLGAMANAVAHAIGVRPLTLPMKPGRVLELMGSIEQK